MTRRSATAAHLGSTVTLDQVRVHHPRDHQAKDGLRAIYGVATSQRDACLPADVHTSIQDLLQVQYSMWHSISDKVTTYRPGLRLP
jgi:hypothetical protein